MRGKRVPQTYCRACASAAAQAWGRKHPARHNARQRQLRETYPEKFAARRKVQQAIKAGRLVRLPCAVCGDHQVEAHHDDYTKPLEVVWLCHVHHGERHRSVA